MTNENKLSFWEHLDALRTALLRIVIVTTLFAIVAFCLKQQLFAAMLAPQQEDFVTYRLFRTIGSWFAQPTDAPVSVPLINTGLAGQFVIHMKAALAAGALCASPYILYQLYRFVSPALYTHERRYAVRVVGGGYAMFLTGVVCCYFLIFPLTFRFLGTYQVSDRVTNLISLQSYVSTLMVMSLAMGLVFEIPLLSWFFAKLGFLTAAFMQRYRKHAIILILILAAIITPTSDLFTLSLVALPMWLLYEISIGIVKRTETTDRPATSKSAPQSDAVNP